MRINTSRRWLWRALLALLALVVASSVLLWFFPARWALAWMTPRLHGLRVAQVSGLLWDGRAGEVRLADGRLLGAARWHVSRRALWAPEPLTLQVRGPQLELEATVRGAGDAMVWHDVHLRVDLALWRPQPPPRLGLPRGQWEMHVQQLVMQAGWPLRGAWQASWHDAALSTRDGMVALGTLEVRGSARDGVIDAALVDTGGGPLQVAGSVRLTPLGWRLDARLQARNRDPALRRWLATLGPTDAAGAIRVQRAGGLAAVAAPAPAASAIVRGQIRGKP